MERMTLGRKLMLCFEHLAVWTVAITFITAFVWFGAFVTKFLLIPAIKYATG